VIAEIISAFIGLVRAN